MRLFQNRSAIHPLRVDYFSSVLGSSRGCAGRPNYLKAMSARWQSTLNRFHVTAHAQNAEARY
jgi:hypothetical protein